MLLDEVLRRPALPPPDGRDRAADVLDIPALAYEGWIAIPKDSVGNAKLHCGKASNGYGIPTLTNERVESSSTRGIH